MPFADPAARKLYRAAWEETNKLKRAQQRRAYYANHKAKFRARNVQYRTKNKEAARRYRKATRDAINIAKKEWAAKNPAKIKAMQLHANKKQSATLHNIFVKQLIRQQLGIPNAMISRPLIEAKRMQLKVRRVVNLLAKNDQYGLEIQMTAFSIGDLEREIRNANQLRRNTRDAGGSNDRPSGKKDRP